MPTIHLPLFGQDRTVDIDLPAPARPADIMRAAARLADAVVAPAALLSKHAGKRVSCKAGCGHCCRQLVRLSTVEALAIAALVDALPEPRRTTIRERFSQGMHLLRQAGLVKPQTPGDPPALSVNPGRIADSAWIDLQRHWYGLNIPCPFLEDESCSIYEHRPAVCREYLVTTPAEHCAAFNIYHWRTVELPLYVSEKLCDVVATDTHSGRVALIFSLEYAQATAAEPIHGPTLLSRLQQALNETGKEM